MSPASACCLRNCSRTPTRSMSSALWRPFRVCRGRRQRNFFSQRLGQLRPADANPLSRLDLDLQPRDRPVASVGYRLLEQGRDDTQSCFTLHRGRAGRHAGLQRRNAAAHEVAAPQAYRVLAHAERLGDPRTGPAASVSSIARALSASPRSREPARTVSVHRCSSVAVSREIPAMPCPRESMPAQAQNQAANRWSIGRILLSAPSLTLGGGWKGWRRNTRAPDIRLAFLASAHPAARAAVPRTPNITTALIPNVARVI